jgi:hypothetical protein
MSKFLYVYHGGGGMPQSEDEGEKIMKAWNDWFGKLGPAVVDGGNPVGMSRTVVSNGSVMDNGGSNPTSGYSIIEAPNLDDATTKAKGCPILARGGSVEVAEIIPM